MIGSKPFIGVEIEGTNKGINTLFIPKNSLLNVDFHALYSDVKKQKISRYYFGAGNKTGISKSEERFIQFLQKQSDHNDLLLEFTENDLPLPDCIAEGVELIFVIHNTKLKYPVNHFKFVNNDKVVWHTIENTLFTNLNDQEYLNDKILKL